jgi:hypothetical protein
MLFIWPGTTHFRRKSRCRLTGWPIKPAGDQIASFAVASFEINAGEDDEGEAMAVSCSGHGDRVTRLCDVTSLEAITSFNMAEQMVMGMPQNTLGRHIRAERVIKSRCIAQRSACLSNS